MLQWTKFVKLIKKNMNEILNVVVEVASFVGNPVLLEFALTIH